MNFHETCTAAAYSIPNGFCLPACSPIYLSASVLILALLSVFLSGQTGITHPVIQAPSLQDYVTWSKTRFGPSSVRYRLLRFWHEPFLFLISLKRQDFLSGRPPFLSAYKAALKCNMKQDIPSHEPFKMETTIFDVWRSKHGGVAGFSKRSACRKWSACENVNTVLLSVLKWDMQCISCDT